MTAILPLPDANSNPSMVFRVRPPPPGGLVDLYELELFPYFFRESEDELAKILGIEQKYIDEQLAQGADEQLNESGMVAAEYFSKRARRSHIFYLTSLLQTAMVRACETLARLQRFDMNEKLRAYKGDQWLKKRKLLEEFGGIFIPAATCDVLSALVALRNNLAHSNGEIQGLSDKERAKLETLPGLTIGQYEVSVGAATVDHCFAATHQAVDVMQDGLQQVHARLSPKTP